MERLEGKRVLVTGAAGFVGAHLVRRLIAEEAIVHAVVRPGSDCARIAEVEEDVTIHEVDLTDPEATRSLIASVAPDGVFHLAALNKSYDKDYPPEMYQAINEEAPIRLMDLMQDRSFDFFINTDTFASIPAKETPITEEDEPVAREPYTASRLKATTHAKELGARGLPYVTVRVFTPYGPWMHTDTVLARMVIWALNNQQMRLTDPAITRDFIYVEDLVDIYVRVALKAKEYPGHVFNGGVGQAVTLKDAAEAVIAATDSTSVVGWGSEKAAYDGGCIAADLTKVRSLGWEPRYSFAEGLKLTIGWLRTQL